MKKVENLALSLKLKSKRFQQIKDQPAIIEKNLLQENKEILRATPMWTFPYLDQWGLGRFDFFDIFKNILAFIK